MTDRDRLILDHKHLVALTVKRMLPKIPTGIETDDLISAGTLGLMRAADRFDPARGVAFRSLAIGWIRGAIREYLRQDDWVTRGARERERRDGEPVIEVVSLEDTSFEDEWGNEIKREGMIADPNMPVETQVVEQMERQLLRAFVRWLPPGERALLVAYYWRGETFEQYAGRVGRSESRVHQWHQEALGRLRSWLEHTGAIHGL